MTLLALDSRWRRFNDETRACPCCGKRFNGIFDIGFDQPQDWPHAPREGDTDVISGDDRLGSELCAIQGRYFIRCVLTLPVKGADDSFSFGPWAEVAEPVFRAYVDSFTSNRFEPAEGLLANTLPGFEDEHATLVSLGATDGTQRPALTATDGPLADALENGISFDDLLDIYAASGSDIRPHLTQD